MAGVSSLCSRSTGPSVADETGVAVIAKVFVCDCGRTKLVLEPPAGFPYQIPDGNLTCGVCGTYVKDYPASEVDE